MTQLRRIAEESKAAYYTGPRRPQRKRRRADRGYPNPEWLMRHAREVGRSGVDVYGVIAWYADRDQTVTQAHIADLVGLSLPQVERYVRRLKALGLITMERQGRGNASVYRVTNHIWRWERFGE